MEAPALVALERSATRSRRNRELGLRPKRSKHGLVLNRSKFEAFMVDRIGRAVALGEDGKVSAEAIAAYLEVGVGTVQNALVYGKPISHPLVSALLKKIRGGDRHLEEFLIATEAGADLAA